MHANPIASPFGLVFNSDRRACVLEIKQRGLEGFATFMAEQKRQSSPRRGS